MKSYNMEQKNHILGPLLIILTILVLAVAGYIWRGGKLPGIPIQLAEKPVEVVKGRAPEGQLLSDFPKELVLASDSDIKSSLVMEPLQKEGNQLISTTYTTKATVADLYAGYVAYLNEHGYKVMTSASQPRFATLVGELDGTVISINVTVIDNNTREVRVDLSRP